MSVKMLEIVRIDVCEHDILLAGSEEMINFNVTTLTVNGVVSN